MSDGQAAALVRAGPIPDLEFVVLDAGPLRHAASPTLRLGLRIESTGGEAIRSIVLETQIQIAARRRPYDDATETRLFELFGEPARWATTLRTLLWARTTTVVPAFDGSTTVDLLVPCSYDIEMTAGRYLDALRDGEVPLELLFGGTLFYSASDGRLQTARIAWDKEVDYRLPASAWHETMDLYFPASAWLRLGRDAYDRLSAFRAQNALTSWDDTVESLLRGEREG